MPPPSPRSLLPELCDGHGTDCVITADRADLSLTTKYPLLVTVLMTLPYYRY